MKILPSAIYWSGLKSWGIRRFEPSRGEYHSRVDDLYAKREMSDEPLSTWHPALPDPPESFPEAADMRLRREEAEFLQDRIIASHPKSLLALLARGGDRTVVDFPWEHPRYESFKEEHKETLHHARLFSEMKHGAAVLYNLEVARKAGDEELSGTRVEGAKVSHHLTFEFRASEKRDWEPLLREARATMDPLYEWTKKRAARRVRF